jgi:hypothetical protein
MKRGILALLLLAMVPARPFAGPATAGAAATPATPSAAPAARPAAATARPAAPEQLAGEVARLRRVAAGIPGDDEAWEALRPGVERLLAAADKEIAAGRLYYGAERLGEARQPLLAVAYRTARPEAGRDMERFMAAWREADAVLTADEGRLKTGGWRGSPAAIRALGESASGQARHLYRAARDYAAADGPVSGLHYVGEALAALDFANFCRGLRFATAAPAAPPTAPPRTVAPELAALEAKVRAAYVPPRSIDNHADFIRIHATLKHAAELDAAGLRFGALHAYLKARRNVDVLEAGWAGRPAPAVAALRLPRDRASERLAARGRDDSIGTLFLQQADSLIEQAAATDTAANPAASPAPDPGTGAQTAAAILDDVVPAYFATLAPAPDVAPPRADALRVTLVRWPYT